MKRSVSELQTNKGNQANESSAKKKKSKHGSKNNTQTNVEGANNLQETLKAKSGKGPNVKAVAEPHVEADNDVQLAPSNNNGLSKLAKKKLMQKKAKAERAQKKVTEKGPVGKTDSKVLSSTECDQNSVVKDETGDVAKDILKKKKKERQLQKKLKRREESGNNNDTHRKSSPDQTVFVGNLPTNTKLLQLINLFKEIGKVESVRFVTASGKQIFKHKMRRESPSLNAYVVFENADIAKKALNLNGVLFKEHHLRITDTQSKCLESFKEEAKNIVVVGNLKYSASEENLRQVFSSCGEINYVRCMRNDKGCIGVAYVCFKAAESIGLAMELNETMIDDRPIRVERYSLKKLAQNAIVDKNQKSKLHTTNAAERRINLKEKNAASLAASSQKKSEFRGIKVKGIKKKNKKSKATNEMQSLAMKIAPKLKDAKET